MRLRLLFVVSVFCACGPPPAQVDAGPHDAGSADAGIDAGTSDAGFDAGALDAGSDAGTPDAGTDGGTFDAGTDAGFDAGTFDAGTDAGALDAGFDAGEPDAGFDAGFDAGEPVDASVPLDDAGCRLAGGAGAPFELRVMAANLTSGNGQSYDPGHGIRIIQGLHPDIVMLQEMNYGTNTPAAMETFMAVLDGGYRYARGAGQIPNGVLSRYPILDAGEWPDPQVGNRGFAWAQVDLPGPRDVFVVSVHLLTASSSERNTEATALLARLDANVPRHDFLLIGGDFNTDTASEPALSTLGARVSDGPTPPADQSGNPNTNANRNKPYDHVLVSQCLQVSQLDAGLVFDSRVFMPLTDVVPVLAGDSAAPSMQHMGVVKDFTVQP